MIFVIDTTSRPAKPHGVVLFSNSDQLTIDNFVTAKVKGRYESYTVVGGLQTRGTGDGGKKSVSDKVKDKNNDPEKPAKGKGKGKK